MNDILKTVFSLTVSGSMIAVILFAARPLWKNRVSKTWQYYIWLSVIVRLLIPFSFGINIPNNLFAPMAQTANHPIVHSVDDYPASDIEKTAAETNTQQNLTEPAAINGEEPDEAYATAVQENIRILWFIGFAVLMMKKIISYLVYTSYIKAKRKSIIDENLLAVYHATCAKAGIRRKIGLYAHKTIPSPMLVGFVKPYILLPEAVLTETNGLQYILLHELTHYRRSDFLYKWLVQFAVCVHFFNPAVYFIRKAINKACEFSCDEMVIQKLDEQGKKAYGTALIDTLALSGGFNQPAISFMLCEDAQIIKERLGAIMKYKRSSKFGIAFAVFLTSMISLGAMFTGVYAQSEVTKPESLPANNLVAPTGEKDLQAIPIIQNAAIDVFAYDGTWADGTGIQSNTYKGQLDEKIKFIEALYKEKNEKFVIFENISEKEVTNPAGIKYMFSHSTVYQNMVAVTDSLFVSSKDRAFTSSLYGGEKEYERSAFYIDRPAKLALQLDYTLSKGKLSIYVVSPDGEVVYQNKPSKQFSETVDLSLDAGLWSIILLNEYENGRIYGNKGISGAIAYPIGQSPLRNDAGYKTNNSYIQPAEQIDINLPVIKINEYSEYGPYNLKKDDVISANLTWSNVEGGVYFAIGKKYYDFKGFHSSYGKWGKLLQKDIVVQEDGLYYIFVGNPTTGKPAADKASVENVSGSITINRKSISSSQTDKNSPVSRSDSLIQNFAKYKPYGVTYNAQQDAVYYNGERVKLFVDFSSQTEDNMTYAFDLCYQDINTDSMIYLEAVEDGKGNITGIRKLQNAMANDLILEGVVSAQSSEGSKHKEKEEDFNEPEHIRNYNGIEIYDESYSNGETVYLAMDATYIIESASITAKDLTKDKANQNIKNWIAKCDKKQGAYLLKIKIENGYDTYIYYNGGGRYPWNMDVSGETININLYNNTTLSTDEGYYLMHFTAPKDYKNMNIYLDGSKLSYDVAYPN